MEETLGESECPSPELQNNDSNDNDGELCTNQQSASDCGSQSPVSLQDSVTENILLREHALKGTEKNDKVSEQDNIRETPSDEVQVDNLDTEREQEMVQGRNDIGSPITSEINIRCDGKIDNDNIKIFEGQNATDLDENLSSQDEMEASYTKAVDEMDNINLELLSAQESAKFDHEDNLNHVENMADIANVKQSTGLVSENVEKSQISLKQVELQTDHERNLNLESASPFEKIETKLSDKIDSSIDINVHLEPESGMTKSNDLQHELLSKFVEESIDFEPESAMVRDNDKSIDNLSEQENNTENLVVGESIDSSVHLEPMSVIIQDNGSSAITSEQEEINENEIVGEINDENVDLEPESTVLRDNDQSTAVILEHEEITNNGVLDGSIFVPLDEPKKGKTSNNEKAMSVSEEMKEDLDKSNVLNENQDNVDNTKLLENENVKIFFSEETNQDLDDLDFKDLDDLDLDEITEDLETSGQEQDEIRKAPEKLDKNIVKIVKAKPSPFKKTIPDNSCKKGVKVTQTLNENKNKDLGRKHASSEKVIGTPETSANQDDQNKDSREARVGSVLKKVLMLLKKEKLIKEKNPKKTISKALVNKVLKSTNKTRCEITKMTPGNDKIVSAEANEAKKRKTAWESPKPSKIANTEKGNTERHIPSPNPATVANVWEVAGRKQLKVRSHNWLTNTDVSSVQPTTSQNNAPQEAHSVPWVANTDCHTWTASADPSESNRDSQLPQSIHEETGMEIDIDVDELVPSPSKQSETNTYLRELSPDVNKGVILITYLNLHHVTKKIVHLVLKRVTGDDSYYTKVGGIYIRKKAKVAFVHVKFRTLEAAAEVMECFKRFIPNSSDVLFKGVEARFDDRSVVDWGEKNKAFLCKPIGPGGSKIPKKKATTKVKPDYYRRFIEVEKPTIPAFTEELDPYDTLTYGLSAAFLEKHLLRPPLNCYIFVRNFDADATECQVLNIFGIAGTIHAVIMKVYGQEMRLRIRYDHPLEALQAVSMFDRQEVFGRIVKVEMFRQTRKQIANQTERPLRLTLPEGLAKTGPGLGPGGTTIDGVRTTIEIALLKNQCEKEINKLKATIDELKKQLETSKPEQNPTNMFAQMMASSLQNPLAALGLLGIQQGMMQQMAAQDPNLLSNMAQSTLAQSNIAQSIVPMGNRTPSNVAHGITAQNNIAQSNIASNEAKTVATAAAVPNWAISKPDAPTWSQPSPLPTFTPHVEPNISLQPPHPPDPAPVPVPQVPVFYQPYQMGYQMPDSTQTGYPSMVPVYQLGMAQGYPTVANPYPINPGSQPETGQFGQSRFSDVQVPLSEPGVANVPITINPEISAKPFTYSKPLEVPPKEPIQLGQINKSNFENTKDLNKSPTLIEVRESVKTKIAALKLPAKKDLPITNTVVNPLPTQSQTDIPLPTAKPAVKPAPVPVPRPMKYVPPHELPKKVLSRSSSEKIECREPEKTFAREPERDARRSPHVSDDTMRENERDMRREPEKTTKKEPWKEPTVLLFRYLPPSVKEADLRDKMGELGKLDGVEMTGKGQAIVAYKHACDADTCIDMFNKSKVDGQTISVKKVYVMSDKRKLHSTGGSW